MIKRVNLNGSIYYQHNEEGIYPSLRTIILSKAKDFNFYECLDVIHYIKLEIAEQKTLQRKLVKFSLFEMLYYSSRVRYSEEGFLSKAIIKAESEVSKEIGDFVLSSQIGR